MTNKRLFLLLFIHFLLGGFLWAVVVCHGDEAKLEPMLYGSLLTPPEYQGREIKVTKRYTLELSNEGEVWVKLNRFGDDGGKWSPTNVTITTTVKPTVTETNGQWVITFVP